MSRIIPLNEPRCRLLIARAIVQFGLALTGLTVLTEAATGYYLLTPLIAALAGAQQVLALTRDSRYGAAAAVREATLALADKWQVADVITVLSDRNDPRLCEADIVTNLGFVRPLNQGLLEQLKPTAVIPLMWETWEYRPEDLDLAACRAYEVPVLGTNEHDPALAIFDFVGQLAVKLLFEAGIEVLRSRLVVWGSGEFAEQSVAALQRNLADVAFFSTATPGALQCEAARTALQAADALVIVEHHHRHALIGPLGEISAQALYALNPGLTVVHVCGHVDRDSLAQAGIVCHPTRFAPPGYMSVATDYVGPKPLIDLHTAGLRVGQELAYVRRMCSSAWETELTVLRRLPLAQGFAGYHDKEKAAS